MENQKDYYVHAEVAVLLDSGDSEECNAQLLPDVQEAFVEHVTEAFMRDDELWENILEYPEFQFNGHQVRIEYPFACRSTSTEMAERFSADCVRQIQAELEAFGCTLEKVECMAEEIDDAYTKDVISSPAPQSKGKKRSQSER